MNWVMKMMVSDADLCFCTKKFVTVNEVFEITQFRVTIASNCGTLYAYKLYSMSRMSERYFVSDKEYFSLIKKVKKIKLSPCLTN
jgi:hypothetical protein